MGKEMKFILTVGSSKEKEYTKEEVAKVENKIFQLMIDDYKLQGELDT